ncbi:MAG: OadG family transporter subunit [Lachnospiraceae bacterium]|nr:OadG family transporter subunit [Lachnospiraceae bacterium]
MKRRLCAVLLATGLAVSAFSTGVFAEETETEAVTEQVTEAAADSAAEAESEIAAVEQEAQSEMSEAAEAASYDPSAQVKTYMEQYLSQLSTMSDEQLQSMVDNGDTTSAKLAYTWMGVKEDLGNFVELGTPEVTMGTTSIEAVAEAKYDGVGDNTTVEVTFDMNQDGTFTMDWNVDYPMSVLMQQAALNTLMGVGIVFLALLFLSFLISKLHYIPDMIESRAKKNAAPAPVPAAAPAPAAAPVEEEEELVDDCELAAVIAAAIAAAENTSTDGFVVRSIRKANKRNWQRA